MDGLHWHVMQHALIAGYGSAYAKDEKICYLLLMKISFYSHHFQCS